MDDVKPPVRWKPPKPVYTRYPGAVTCTGPEMNTSPADGGLRFRNTRPGAWPGGSGAGCTPAAASGLYRDPAVGVWAPPVDFLAFYQRQDSGPISIPVNFGTWALNGLEIVGTAIPASPSGCAAQQFATVTTFTINAQVPQNTGLAWVLSASTTPAPAMPPPSAYIEHGRFKGWADGLAPTGTVYAMARTDTLQRFMYRAAGAAPNFFQWQAVTAFQANTGAPLPVITRLVIETLIYGFDTRRGGNTSPAI